MVFLNKNRDKPLNGKKKPQVAAATTTVPQKTTTNGAIAAAQTPTPTQATTHPIQFAVKSSPQTTAAAMNRDSKLPPALHLNPPALAANPAQRPMSTPLPSAAAPWWVSDVTFIVEGKKIPGHKVVLQSRSGYFSQLFQGSTQDVTLEITDFSHHIFSQFVRWVYGGKKEIVFEDATELARCALFFQAAELVSLCQRLMEEAGRATKPEPLSHHSQQQQQQQQQQQSLPTSSLPTTTTAITQTAVVEEVSMQMEDVEEPSPLPPSPQYDAQHDPIITGMAHPDIAMIELLEESPLMADHTTNYVSADAQQNDFGFGMNIWSSDPVLYPSEATDAYRIMEIC